MIKQIYQPCFIEAVDDDFESEDDGLERVEDDESSNNPEEDDL